MTDVDTAALRDLLAKATPGEWRTWNDGHVGSVDRIGGIFMPTMGSDHDQRLPDAKAVAALVNAAPALLDAAEAVEDAEARLKAANELGRAMTACCSKNAATIERGLALADKYDRLGFSITAKEAARDIRAALAAVTDLKEDE